ncbi:pentatricopeptide repeat-containing protein [Prunus yedoensis var. nudiflora]|uniref:Pentatricopeptide repeat-containing protein n=1 Tax=Prunus yedoensis var. nudiflora TaxID=2094558 RepID=A0A314YNV0_PRUYE|nr:pentatricopeptide repeat-containing protein [Prunus yedoensis var. nudiflora]
MASLSSPTQPPPPPFNRPPVTKPVTVRSQTTFSPQAIPPPLPSSTNSNSNKTNSLTVTQRSRSKILDIQKLKDKEAKERKEETNKKTASRKAISVILRREATKDLIEKKKGSKRLLPRTVLEAIHERITALRWESALKVFELLHEQQWYRPNAALYG